MSNAVFMECDIQGKLGKHMVKNHCQVQNARRFTQLAQVMDIPVIATQHVAKNFGPVDSKITDGIDYAGRKTFDKTLFSMLTPEVEPHL